LRILQHFSRDALRVLHRGISNPGMFIFIVISQLPARIGDCWAKSGPRECKREQRDRTQSNLH
jgi:hypothetical protein